MEDRSAAGLAHSATVVYLSKISVLELQNSELEIQVKVSQAEIAKLREQLRTYKSKHSDSTTSDRFDSLQRLNAELSKVKEQLQCASEERDELMNRLREQEKRTRQAEKELQAVREKYSGELATLLAQNDMMKASARLEQRPKSETPHLVRVRDKAANPIAKIDEDPSERVVLTELSGELLHSFNLEEVNLQLSPHRPYKPDDVLFASERKPKPERLRSSSAHDTMKRCLSRASSRTAGVRYVPSSQRTWKKLKIAEEATTHVNLPRVSEIKISPYLKARGDSFSDDLPDDLDLPERIVR